MCPANREDIMAFRREEHTPQRTNTSIVTVLLAETVSQKTKVTLQVTQKKWTKPVLNIQDKYFSKVKKVNCTINYLGDRW